MQAEPLQISDSDLIHAVALGDELALAACYDRYRLILFGLILRILHDREEAEDVLQEVFLQVWRRAGDFDEARGRAFTWLVTIARSRALDRLRSAGSRARLGEEAAQELSAKARASAGTHSPAHQGDQPRLRVRRHRWRLVTGRTR